MSTMPSAGLPSVLSPTRWAALFIPLSGIFMDMMDTTIINVALPSIQRSLDAGPGQLAWMVAAYTLTFAIVLTTGGRLGDLYGRRRLFTFGACGSAAASVLSGLAGSAVMLITSRALQGAAAALMVPQVMSFIQVEFPDRERRSAFGLFGATFALGALAGPLVGGLLLRADLLRLDWRPLFLVNAPIAASAAALMALVARESSPRAVRARIRWEWRSAPAQCSRSSCRWSGETRSAGPGGSSCAWLARSCCFSHLSSTSGGRSVAAVPRLSRLPCSGCPV